MGADYYKKAVAENLLRFNKMSPDDAAKELATAWKYLEDRDKLPKSLKESNLKDRMVRALPLYWLAKAKEEAEQGRLMWIGGELGEVCVRYNQEQQKILEQILQEHPTWKVDGHLLASEVQRRYEQKTA